MWAIAAVLLFGSYSGLIIVFQYGAFERQRIETASERDRQRIESRLEQRDREIVRRLERIEMQVERIRGNR